MRVLCPVVCPVCNSKYDVSQGQNGSIYKELLDLAARFGTVWKLVEEYIEAFRAEQYSSISLKKRLRLLAQLIQLWEKCEFEYKGKRYRTGKAQIREAIVVVCNREKFGFENHNYLKAVLVDTSERVSASGHTAKEEAEREEERRHKAHGTRHTDGDDAPLPVEEFQKRIGALADQIGNRS